MSALLASHHSTARPLDSSPMPLTVSVTLHVVRVTIDEPHSRLPAVQEYVQVFIHPLERTVSRGGYEIWASSTPSRSSPLLSAFETAPVATGSTGDNRERRPRSFSARRIESSGSGAMPVVSLRGVPLSMPSIMRTLDGGCIRCCVTAIWSAAHSHLYSTHLLRGASQSEPAP